MPRKREEVTFYPQAQRNGSSFWVAYFYSAENKRITASTGIPAEAKQGKTPPGACWLWWADYKQKMLAQSPTGNVTAASPSVMQTWTIEQVMQAMFSVQHTKERKQSTCRAQKSASKKVIQILGQKKMSALLAEDVEKYLQRRRDETRGVIHRGQERVIQNDGMTRGIAVELAMLHKVCDFAGRFDVFTRWLKVIRKGWPAVTPQFQREGWTEAEEKKLSIAAADHGLIIGDGWKQFVRNEDTWDFFRAAEVAGCIARYTYYDSAGQLTAIMARPVELYSLQLRHLHFVHAGLPWEPFTLAAHNGNTVPVPHWMPRNKNRRPRKLESGQPMIDPSSGTPYPWGWLDIEYVGKFTSDGPSGTKNQASERDVPLTPQLHAWFSYLLERAVKLGACRPDHYLFPKRLAHGVYDPTRCQSRWEISWRNVCKVAGVPYKDFYNNRHTGCTRASELGAGTKQIQLSMGHSGEDMQKFYTHDRLTSMIPSGRRAKSGERSLD